MKDHINDDAKVETKLGNRITLLENAKIKYVAYATSLCSIISTIFLLVKFVIIGQ